MEISRYLQCLAADASRLRDVAQRDLSARVPSCPEWASSDLLQHTAMVYLHKAESMRVNRPMSEADWPPDVGDEDPVALFDRAYADLCAEFATREPDEQTGTWYAPEQTVGFWIRRMAQETVIHRVDAELAQGERINDIPSDLAVDGIDEVLVVFLGYISTTYRDELGEYLNDLDGRSVRVTTPGRSWTARLDPDGVLVLKDGTDDVAATVSGDPQGVLLWLWRRTGDDAVQIDGDPAAAAKLRDLMGMATV